jgi:hypothetical protein
LRSVVPNPTEFAKKLLLSRSGQNAQPVEKNSECLVSGKPVKVGIEDSGDNDET